ncbi:uncharacterized protein LOC131588733 [Poecile atricapillus]|uniref:uncharacterized protein LOC131588733 n=1 Tax=Poecile atricapillus TaxID=48891 RepID=UPI0027381B2D|nr:uncharacterized protein LOC131588733 [Poecile atricapillus]
MQPLRAEPSLCCPSKAPARLTPISGPTRTLSVQLGRSAELSTNSTAGAPARLAAPLASAPGGTQPLAAALHRAKGAAVPCAHGQRLGNAAARVLPAAERICCPCAGAGLCHGTQLPLGPGHAPIAGALLGPGLAEAGTEPGRGGAGGGRQEAARPEHRAGAQGPARLGRRSGGMRRARGAALAALLLAAVARAQVQQEPSLETTEGSGINITCSHAKIQTNDWIYWYRQLQGRGPELVALTMKESKDVPAIAGRLWVSADRRSSALWLGWPRRGDSAVYYCALGARAEGPGLRPGTNRRGRGRAGPGAQRRPRPAGGAAPSPPGPARLRSSLVCPEPARSDPAQPRTGPDTRLPPAPCAYTLAWTHACRLPPKLTHSPGHTPAACPLSLHTRLDTRLPPAP